MCNISWERLIATCLSDVITNSCKLNLSSNHTEPRNRKIEEMINQQLHTHKSEIHHVAQFGIVILWARSFPEDPIPQKLGSYDPLLFVGSDCWLNFNPSCNFTFQQVNFAKRQICNNSPGSRVIVQSQNSGSPRSRDSEEMKKQWITGACQHTGMKGTGSPVAIMFMFGNQCIHFTRDWTSALESNAIYVPSLIFSW